jgi:alkylation response protein AidB-like acyl-CoA dehydrogenase
MDPEAFFADWVRPRAGRIDEDPEALREALAEMGRRGLLGLRVPREHGGLGLEPLAFRRLQEACARASGALAFLESQHQSACGLLARSPNAGLRARLLPRFARGEASSAIAFSHLRRPGAPAVVATPTPGGWRLDGRLPWVTGWGFFTHCSTAAIAPDGRVLFAVHPLAASDALCPSEPLRLAAMEVTCTVEIELRGLPVPEADVVELHPASWIRENDRLAPALQSPLALGCAQAGVDVLRGKRPEAADRLQAELDAVRAAAYAAMEEGADFDAGLRARAAAIELAVRAAHAAVVAWAGAANRREHPAQRVYREALAFSVLALTPPLQEALLSHLTRR